jgi:hypothetical protein
MISEEALQEFMQLYQEEYGVELDKKTATDLAVNLLTFFKTIYRPIKKEWLNEYKKNNN